MTANSSDLSTGPPTKILKSTRCVTDRAKLLLRDKGWTSMLSGSFWREADIRRSVRSEECQCARRHHHPKGANNYSGPKLSRTILSFSSLDQRRRVRIHRLEPLDLRTALFTVHRDGSQHQAPTDKAAFSEGIRGASRQNNSIAM
jgi:hypothetical protein